ncbi:MAG TPA: VOC family protein [Pseudonocardiaceae bacterium]|jgi:catechol 2,3-dioxygenase-like lactoylglutathione lyase family enzyme|nr:VOC family protein [Pseudonocardiaceae bacterium]
MPELAGIHHVKFAVSDIERSVAWYERVFGFKVTMEFKDDEGIVRGSVGQLAGLDKTLLAFRENKELSEAVTGFDPVSFAVEDRADVEAWVAHLNEQGVENSGLRIAAIGYIVFFHDPDGIKLHVYSFSTPRPDEIEA